MVCKPHRLQCNTPHFTKHEFPTHNTECSNTAEITTVGPKYSGTPNVHLKVPLYSHAHY